MSPELNRGPARALYMQIADHYRDTITRGDLAPGDRLPTIQELSREWGVSQRTAQKAMDELRGEKLVSISRREGTRVAPMRAAQGGRDVIVEPTGSAAGDVVEITSAKVVAAPDYVADLLEIDPDPDGQRRVSRREAVAYRSGVPVRLSVSWSPPWAFEATPELLEPRLINGLKAVKGATGRAPTQGRDYFEGRGADNREAGHLGVRVGEPILAGTSLWWDDQGKVEYREWVSPAGHVCSVDYPVEID